MLNQQTTQILFVISALALLLYVTQQCKPAKKEACCGMKPAY